MHRCARVVADDFNDDHNHARSDAWNNYASQAAWAAAQLHCVTSGMHAAVAYGRPTLVASYP
jgi:hypothetical protein